MTTRALLTEAQWAAAAGAAGVTLDGAFTPLSPAAGPAPDDAVACLGPLESPDVTVDLLAARGKRGWIARIAGDAAGHVCVVRTLDTSRRDRRIGVVPGIEVGHGVRSELLDSVLRLIPGIKDGVVNPRMVTVPTEHLGAVIAATNEDSPRTRAGLLDLLDWDDIPVEVDSLSRVDGDITVTVTAPGRRTRVIRLLHGHDGWISIAIDQRHIGYRCATGPWLQAELTWELAAAMEAAR